MQAEGKSRCILILAGVDAQVLLDPLEEELPLPMRLQVGDDKSAVATRSLGQEDEETAVIRHRRNGPSGALLGNAWTASQSGQDDGMVALAFACLFLSRSSTGRSSSIREE